MKKSISFLLLFICSVALFSQTEKPKTYLGLTLDQLRTHVPKVVYFTTQPEGDVYIEVDESPITTMFYFNQKKEVIYQCNLVNNDETLAENYYQANKKAFIDTYGKKGMLKFPNSKKLRWVLEGNNVEIDLYQDTENHKVSYIMFSTNHNVMKN